ncbi:hypothetical protein AB205_0031540, partial [Aquarana catesbeiana]
LPIENLVRGVTAQNIAVDVVDGPYDENTTAYHGAIEITRGNNAVLRYRFLSSKEDSEQHSSVVVTSPYLTPNLLRLPSLEVILALQVLGYRFLSSKDDSEQHSSDVTISHSKSPEVTKFGSNPCTAGPQSSLIPIAIFPLQNHSSLARGFYIACLILLPSSNLIGFMIGLIHIMASDAIIPIVCAYMVIPYAQVFIFWGLLWFLEWRRGTSFKRDPVFRFTKRKPPFFENPEQLDDADEDVLAEKERVNTLKTTDQDEERPIILVDSLRKEFEEKSGMCGCFRKKKKRMAISHSSFCVKKGEVLGLLGPNRAGKTTSLLILAGEMKPTAGQVVLGKAGDPLRTEDSAALGFCPQHNPLWPNLTVKEHLEIYAAVKGMNKEDTDRAIKRVSEALEMKDHLDKPAKKLSAGVSRKVCFAIGMLGNPTIVLLDEPSTGRDPEGQQRLWRAIRADFKNRERGAILTTHYVEEAEAVCDRVAIMVSGKLRCIGSIQHLKSKFSKGYLLEIRLEDTQQVDVIHQEVLHLFPQAARQDRFSSLLVYKIPMDNVQSLSQAFLHLENAKQTYNIEEYSFSQSTLEQVFLELAKEQEKEDFHLDSPFRWMQRGGEEI